MVLIIRIQYNFHKFLFNPYRWNRHTNIALNSTKYNTILQLGNYLTDKYYILTSLGKDYINFVEFKILLYVRSNLFLSASSWVGGHGSPDSAWKCYTYLWSHVLRILLMLRRQVDLTRLCIVCMFLFLLSFGWKFQTILYFGLHQILHCEFSKRWFMKMDLSQ